MNSPDPRLDPVALAGLLRGRRDTTSALIDRIGTHLDQHRGYIAFSGGKDSLVVLHLARQADPKVPVVFFDSLMEYPETYTYLDQLVDQWDLNWHPIPVARSPLDMMATDGAWDHHSPNHAGVSAAEWFTTLITQPATQAHGMFGPGELWGVRAEESTGRRHAYNTALAMAECACTPTCPTRSRHHRERHGGVIGRGDGTVVFGPVWDWTTVQVWSHIGRWGLPVNPVYDKLAQLGAPAEALRVSHMLDVARLDEGQLVWLRRGWPVLFEELAARLPRLREFV